MYLNRDPCPVSAAPQIQFCAGQGRDHRQCCARNGNRLFQLYLFPNFDRRHRHIVLFHSATMS